MQIVINEGVLSDLFFNYDLTNLRDAQAAAGDDGGLGFDEYAAALLPDAVEFSVMLGGQVSPEWLIADFLKRL